MTVIQWLDICALFFNVAIEAMKNAHKEELEKTQRSQISGLNSDIDELRLQYEYVLQGET